MKNPTFKALLICVITLSFLSGCSFRLPWRSQQESEISAPKTPSVSASVEETSESVTKQKDNDLQNQPQSLSQQINETDDSTDNGHVDADKVDADKEVVMTSFSPSIPKPPENTWERLRRGFRMDTAYLDKEALAKFEQWYSKRPEYFERLADRAYWFLSHILDEVEKRGMPTEVALLPAIESTFRPDATSRSRAAGMWQFMGSTGERFGLDQNWWVDNRRDLVSSTTAALDYLEYLSSEFEGDWELAFASYNAGEGRVSRAIRKNIKKSRPPYYSFLDLSKETKQYIPKLIAVRNIVSSPEKYGITLKHIPLEPTLDTIDAKTQTDLTVVASLVDIPMEQLSFFNRNYKRGVTHPDGPHTIAIPVALSEKLTQKLGNLTPRERLRWARHRVKKGEYLGKIARRHGVTVNSIMSTNNLSSNLIKPGQVLRIPLSTGKYNYSTTRFKSIKAREGDTLYVVQSGDSLWTIAQRANTALSNLLSWNGMTKRTRLYPGQKLIISR